MDIDKPQQGWQWWRISFSTDDAKTQQSESSKSNGTGKYVAPPNTDVIGYTARKVREIEVLRAAREESKSVLLVYANSSAVQFGESPAPTPLQVRMKIPIFFETICDIVLGIRRKGQRVLRVRAEGSGT